MVKCIKGYILGYYIIFLLKCLPPKYKIFVSENSVKFSRHRWYGVS